MDKIWVVMAAFNEEKSVGTVVSNLRSQGYRNVLVVDDGSADNTCAAAKAAGAQVLLHKMNLGQGAALRTGISYALKRGADYVITFDADGQHKVSEIPSLIAPLKTGQYDVALGSRFLKGSNSKVPFTRKLFLKGGAFLMFLFYNVKVTDSHNGFRALTRRAAQAIKITCNRMEHASEIIDEIGRYKLKYKEVPVTVKYTGYSKTKGQSSLNAFRIFYRMIVNKAKKMRN
ncbi:glycosyltransferase family 2 protein [Candidatus Woesearchaeota archaeon]|nr:glycosyltransferase family 2 protein [Candidatus Woesearchaeota archaeon]